MIHTYRIIYIVMLGTGFLNDAIIDSSEYSTNKPLDTSDGYNSCINWLEENYKARCVLLNWKKMWG